MANHLKKPAIGIFGGTFDPIHFGHINLALEMLEKLQLEEVWFCPVRISPHKTEQSASAEERLGMVQLAIQEIPQFKLIDTDVRREGPSYTIDTIKILLDEEKKRAEPRQLCLILGSDTLAGFPHWRSPEEVVKLVPVFMGYRSDKPVSFDLINNDLVRGALERGLVKTTVLDISSTELRQRLANGKYCGHLMPKAVLDYISKKKLYE